MRVVAIAVATVALATACGSSGGTASGSKSSGGGSSPTVATVEQMSKSDCLSKLGPFLNSMQEINSRLDIGMNESEFVQRVGTAKVKHDQLDPKALQGTCLDAGVDLEKALNKYIKAANKWSNCVSNFSCTFKKINAVMQLYWLQASTRISTAEKKVGKLQ